MKIKEEGPMQEIHRIRLDMYEETKNMSAEEYLAYLKKNAERVLAELGLTPRKQKT